MRQELVAHLIRDNERVSVMPTDELLVVLDQLLQVNITQGQSRFSHKAAVYEFLQAVKRAMRTSNDLCEVKPL